MRRYTLCIICTCKKLQINNRGMLQRNEIHFPQSLFWQYADVWFLVKAVCDFSAHYVVTKYNVQIGSENYTGWLVGGAERQSKTKKNGDTKRGKRFLVQTWHIT